MKDYEDEAFDEIEKAQQRRVAHGVTDGSLWRKRQEPDPILAMARHAGFTVENGKITDGTDSGIDISDELRAFAKLVSTKEYQWAT